VASFENARMRDRAAGNILERGVSANFFRAPLNVERNRALDQVQPAEDLGQWWSDIPSERAVELSGEAELVENELSGLLGAFEGRFRPTKHSEMHRNPTSGAAAADGRPRSFASERASSRQPCTSSSLMPRRQAPLPRMTPQARSRDSVISASSSE
jgi:hypothetical protein